MAACGLLWLNYYPSTVSKVIIGRDQHTVFKNGPRRIKDMLRIIK